MRYHAVAMAVAAAGAMSSLLADAFVLPTTTTTMTTTSSASPSARRRPLGGAEAAARAALRPSPQRQSLRPFLLSSTGLRAKGGDDDKGDDDGVNDMRASEIRKELQSYGIPTKSFFEKSELVDALRKARAEGKTPINGDDGGGGGASSSKSSSSSSAAGGASRDERIKAEMEKLKSLKVKELKTELQERGISTKSFFEKSEFVRALAEARADGVEKKPGGAGAGGRTAGGGGRGRSKRQEEEPYDPSYRDVVCTPFDRRDPRMRGGTVIDVRLG